MRITTLEEMHEFAVDLSMRNIMPENTGVSVELTQQEYIKEYIKLNTIAFFDALPNFNDVNSYPSWFTVNYFGIKFFVTFKQNAE